MDSDSTLRPGELDVEPSARIFQVTPIPHLQIRHTTPASRARLVEIVIGIEPKFDPGAAANRLASRDRLTRDAFEQGNFRALRQRGEKKVSIGIAAGVSANHLAECKFRPRSGGDISQLPRWGTHNEQPREMAVPPSIPRPSRSARPGNRARFPPRTGAWPPRALAPDGGGSINAKASSPAEPLPLIPLHYPDPPRATSSAIGPPGGPTRCSVNGINLSGVPHTLIGSSE